MQLFFFFGVLISLLCLEAANSDVSKPEKSIESLRNNSSSTPQKRSKVRKVFWLTHHLLHIIIVFNVLIASSDYSNKLQQYSRIVSIANLLIVVAVISLKLYFWVFILHQLRNDYHVDQGMQRIKNSIYVLPDSKMSMPMSTSESRVALLAQDEFHDWYSEYV